MVWLDPSPIGTFAKCGAPLKLSAYRGRPEATGTHLSDAIDPKRTRAKSRRLDTTSQDQALRRDARLSRFSISSCHCTMDSKFRIVAACDAEQLMDHDFCLAALDGHPPKSAGNDAVRHPFVDVLGDADRGAELLVQSLDSRSNVHAIAHHGIAQSRARADIADNNSVTMDADPHSHLLAAFGCPACIEPLHSAAGPQGRHTGTEYVVLHDSRRSPQGHHAVANELVDRAAFLGHSRRHRLEVLRRLLRQFLRRKLLGDGREAVHVREEDRHEARFHARSYRSARLDQVAYDADGCKHRE